MFSAPGSAHAALGYYRGLRLPPKWIRTIQAPTLVFAGADDPNITPEEYEPARRFFPNGYEVVVIRGGHFCHREDEEVFANQLVEFFKN